MIVAGRPFLVVGHRGAAAKAPENTASSLRAGLDAGADVIEIDVALSSDGRVVLLHDATLDRTTTGRGDVGAWTWSELSRLDAGSWHSRRFRNEGLLDLDGALALVLPRASIVVEIKSRDERSPRIEPADLEVVRGVLEALARTGGLPGATVSSSNWELLTAARGIEERLEVALTVRYRHSADPIAAARRIGASALHPNRRLCKRSFVDAAHEAGLAVIPYTVNRKTELAPLLRVGVDGVFTDDPGLLRRFLAPLAADVAPQGPLTLGIDQGSGGTRAILLSEDDRIVASKAVPVASREGSAGTVVQEPEAIAASVVDAARPLLEEAGPVPVCGIATQRSSLVVWRRSDGRPVGPVLSWRTAGEDGLVPRFLDVEEIVARTTGLTARYPYGAVRLARILADGGEIADGLRSGALVAGPVGAFLAARLGERSGGEVDPSLAQRMLLLDARTRRYDEGLLALTGLDERALPSVMPSAAERGRIRIGRYRPRLTGILGDASAAFRAVAGDSGKGGVLVLGTGGFLLIGTGDAPVRVPGLLTTILWEDARGPRYAVEGTVHGLLGNLLEAGRRAGLEHLSPDLVASRSGPVLRSPRVIAAIEGSGTPEWRTAPRFEIEEGDWTGEEVVRGTLVDVAEQFGVIGDLLRERSLLPPSVLATGGLATSPHLRAAIAERLGVEVVLDRRPERTAVGAALVARSVRGDG